LIPGDKSGRPGIRVRNIVGPGVHEAVRRFRLGDSPQMRCNRSQIGYVCIRQMEEQPAGVIAEKLLKMHFEQMTSAVAPITDIQRLLRHVRKVPAMSGLPEKYSFGETRSCARSKNSNVPPTLAASLKLSRLRVRKFGVGFSLMAGQLELAAGAVRFSRLRTAPPRD
jgi:hypothetical protein